MTDIKLPPIQDELFGAFGPIWRHILDWGAAEPGAAAREHVVAIEAAITKAMHDHAREAVLLNAQVQQPDEWEREIWRKKLESLISEYGCERATEAYHGDHFCKRNPTAIRKEISAMLSAAPAAPAAPQPAQQRLTDEQAANLAKQLGWDTMPERFPLIVRAVEQALGIGVRP